MSTLIVTHSRCMDGLAAAYIAKEAIEESGGHPVVQFQSYGDSTKSILNPPNGLNHIVFVDFCLSHDDMELCCKNYQSVLLLDHHKTALADMEGLDMYPNFSAIFDMDKSGAMIAFDYYGISGSLVNTHLPQLIQYIQDRDLWQWGLENTKEINEGLRHTVEMNSLDSFEKLVYSSTLVGMKTIGEVLLESQANYTTEAIKSTHNIILAEQEFVCINTTVHASEVGNALCTKYNLPSATYRISDCGTKVWWSLRSLDSLPDASPIAKSFGGGGHRNACGFETPIEHLPNLLSKCDWINEDSAEEHY
jgi:oligoribonuclease NrnB/cAMP/cGMP phosphodiesterase (DHH superfamily)